ncbi:dihydroorotase [Spirochaetia bacterium]|nr:dihydroorotase [Spirochaetia bacterium]
MVYNALLKNGMLVGAKESFAADIAVADGKIACIGAADSSLTAELVYDARGKFILPGVIDAHVHFREPGLTHKEDFETGSAAAAYGGITMIADMPNTQPVTSTVERFREKVCFAEEKSYIDFGLFALLNGENAGEIEGLQKAGALGFKIFLGTSTGDIAAPPADIMLEQLRKIAGMGKRIGFHAENNELNARFTALCRAGANPEDPALLARARPDISEADAIAAAIGFAEQSGAHIHIHHVSSRLGADLIRSAKKRLVPVSAETCPHYLLLDEDDYPRLGKAMKVYPPIRSKADREALWAALLDGTIDMIATDHAPHTAEEKERPLWEAMSGLCGVETSVRLMLNEVNKGRLSLNDYVRLASEAPARIWGLYPQKGSFVPGSDADFTIVDMEKIGVIRTNELHSKNKTGVYDGIETRGIPVAAMIRGDFVMRDGELCGKRGFGKFIW